MTRLTNVDWLIVWLYLAGVLGVGFYVKSRARTVEGFFQAGRALPAWICGLAFVSISVGAPELIGVGGLGARYGLQAAHFFGIGAIPAMIFAGIFMMPLYYGSKARTVPEFLGLRFDQKTRVLNASLFLVTTVFSAGIALYAIARAMQGVHVFDNTFLALGPGENGVFAGVVVLLSLLVGTYVILGGLTSAIYNQVIQFFLLAAGLLPVVLLGLKNIGGWAGLKATLPAASMHEWKGVLHANTNPMGIEIIGLSVGLGFALGAGYWCTDFRVIQAALASHDIDAARRVPLIAAIPKMLFPFLVVLPGLLAIALPTPHSVTMVTRNPDGSIVHNIQVVPLQVEQGKGLVPARVNRVTGKPILDASGQPLLDYDMATPNMLLRYFPTGLLGLGLTALMASFMSGMAGNVTAFNTVFTYDMYQSFIHKEASERHYVTVGRWATAGAILLSAGAALVVTRFDNIFDFLQLLFSIVNAPLCATFLLGMFWKRTTGHGAFTGLLAGTLAAVAHHGLTLPIEAHPGIHGGWIAIVHQYPSDMAQNFWGAIFAFSINAVVAVIVSLMTKPRRDDELAGLVHSLTPRLPQQHLAWWQRPESLAAAILIGAIALNIILA